MALSQGTGSLVKAWLDYVFSAEVILYQEQLNSGQEKVELCDWLRLLTDSGSYTYSSLEGAILLLV